MNHHKFSTRSRNNLATLDPDLDRVVTLALKYSKFDFGVTEGLRSLDRQKELLAKGKTTTMRSRHLANKFGDSEAVDLVGYKNGHATYEKAVMRKIAQAMFKAAFELGVAIEWGGHWETFVDMPHFQLTKRED